MEKFVLIVRGGMPPQDQMQAYMQKWGGWIGGLSQSGKMSDGSPLNPGGKMLSGSSSSDIKDFDNNTIGSYMVVNANSIDEAMEIAKGCPALEVGGTIEVRAVMKMNM